MSNWAMALYTLGDFAEAVARLDAGVERGLASQRAAAHLRASALLNLGIIYGTQGHISSGAGLLRRSV